MGRRLRPMTAADLELLPGPCGRCAFAGTDDAGLDTLVDHPAGAGRAAGATSAAARRAQEVTDHWGWCGVLAVHDEEVLGFLTLAPARLVRRPPASSFSATPAGPDVAVLLSVQVMEAWRGRGIGRQLVSTAAGLVTRRDVRALEAVGTRRAGPSCLLPAGWLESVGFEVVREHPVAPLLRMDLQTTQRWPGLGAAWNRLAGLVTVPAVPRPASYVGRDRAAAAPPRPRVQAG